jgi:hypothetical protein
MMIGEGKGRMLGGSCTGVFHSFSHNRARVFCSLPVCLFVFRSTRTDWLSGLTCTDQNFCQKAGGQAFAKAEEEGIALYVSYGYFIRHSLASRVAA